VLAACCLPGADARRSRLAWRADPLSWVGRGVGKAGIEGRNLSLILKRCAPLCCGAEAGSLPVEFSKACALCPEVRLPLGAETSAQERYFGAAKARSAQALR
jgi:hypothetical protein